MGVRASIITVYYTIWTFDLYKLVGFGLIYLHNVVTKKKNGKEQRDMFYLFPVNLIKYYRP